MKGTIRKTVKITWVDGHGERQSIQRECRFTKGTPARVMKAWQDHERGKIRKRIPEKMERGAASGTLTKDAERYYPLTRHMAKWVTRRAEIRAWLKLVGDRPRHTVTKEDVLRIRGEWLSGGVKPKTINNRVTALRQLFRALDGDDFISPCHAVRPLHVSRTPPQVITPDIVNRVLAALQARVGTSPHAAGDYARLMLLATTGKRPCEIERAEPADVDLDRRVWAVRDAKGGWSEGLYLNDEMLMAWQEFVRVHAWGRIPDHFPRRLRDAGWPSGVRPYNLRHSTWITASERGADLADIQAGAGHKNISTTRRHYVPVLNSRMQKLSERLEGRFGWQARLADTEKSA